jgi:hypothetical protein
MGAYLAIVSGALKFANYIAAALQQHHDELSGVNKERAATNAAKAEGNANVAQAAVDTTNVVALGKLRDGAA